MNHIDVVAGLWPHPPLQAISAPLSAEDEALMDRLSKTIVRDESRNGAALRQLVQPELWGVEQRQP